MNRQKPAYLQLYESLREKITQGVWAFGERIPSRRETAREEGLSVITVEHSYELLCQEGYIESRARSGYYVIYRPLDGFAQVSTPRAVIPQRYAPKQENSFPFSVLARTMRRVMTEYGEALLNKSPNTGCDALRQAIARYLARNRGMKVTPEQIVIGSGAEYLYGLVVEMLGRDRCYAIESPSYAKIEQVYRAKGVRCDLLPLTHDGIQSAALGGTRSTDEL